MGCHGRLPCRCAGTSGSHRPSWDSAEGPGPGDEPGSRSGVVKSCPCTSGAFLPFLLRYLGQGRVFFPPLVKGGLGGGGLGAINCGVFGGSSSTRLVAAPGPTGDQREARHFRPRHASPPPLAPPSQGGERKGARLAIFRSRNKTSRSATATSLQSIPTFHHPRRGGVAHGL